MKFLLEAFLSQNFGDDLFVTVLCEHYRCHDFYLMDTEGRAEAIARANSLDNLHPVDPDTVLDHPEEYSAYFFVGGDFYGPHDFTERRARIRAIQAQGGLVFVLGGSLYREYPDWSKPFLDRFFEMPDYVSFRDGTSYAQAFTLCPKVRAQQSCDMAFTLCGPKSTGAAEKRQTLGISVREKWGGTEEAFANYCTSIAGAAAAHLEAGPENKVTFLALSAEGFDDREVAKTICAQIPEALHCRIQHLDYSGSVHSFIRQAESCDGFLCTRFHSLCLALILGKPFAVINYEAKIENLLKDLGFQGQLPAYGDVIAPEALLSALDTNRVDAEAFRQYAALGEIFFQIPDLLLSDTLAADHAQRTAQILNDSLARIHQLEAELAQEKLDRQAERHAMNQRIFDERQYRFDTAAQLSNDLSGIRYWLDIAARSDPMKAAHLAIQLKQSLLGSGEAKEESRRWLKGDRANANSSNYLGQLSRQADLLDATIAKLWKTED